MSSQAATTSTALSTGARQRMLSAPSSHVQKALIDEARTVASDAEGLFARSYRRITELSNARISTVCGVLGFSLAWYLNGIAATWVPSLGGHEMSLSAGFFGAAACILAARSMPKIRELDRSESQAAQAQLEAAATITRFNTFEPLLLRLPEEYKPLVFDQVFHPKLMGPDPASAVIEGDAAEKKDGHAGALTGAAARIQKRRYARARVSPDDATKV